MGQFEGLSREHMAALSPPLRLVVGSAPGPVRHLWAGFFALDRRLAQVVSGVAAGGREPMLAQMRLAWWREMLARPMREWPEGEPLLALLRAWEGEAPALAALAEGWEAMLGEAPLDAAALAALAGARADALAALVRLSGAPRAAERARAEAWRWALADLAAHLGDDVERARAEALLAAADLVPGAAPRAVRPIAALRIMAERALGEGRAIGGLGDWGAALRVGLLGR